MLVLLLSLKSLDWFGCCVSIHFAAGADDDVVGIVIAAVVKRCHYFAIAASYPISLRS